METPPESRLKTLFFESVKDPLLQDCVRVIFADYRRARQSSDEMFGSTSSPESHDTLPLIRRGFIEQDLRAVANRHDGVSATAALNNGNNCYHTQIVSGRVLMTESVVDSHVEIVRLAKFRQGYAETYQLALGLDGEDVEHERPPSDAPIYAILIHGPHPKNLSLPGFVHVVFPSGDCSHYVGRIDLLERFGELADSLRSEVEQIAEPAAPSLRPDVSRERQHGEASG